MCFLNYKLHLLVSEPYIYQNARCKDKNLNKYEYVQILQFPRNQAARYQFYRS